MLRHTRQFEIRSPASPKIDHLFSLAKLNVLSSREYESEKEQMSLIQTLGRDIFGEDNDHNLAQLDQLNKTVSMKIGNKKRAVDELTAKKQKIKGAQLNYRKPYQKQSANQKIFTKNIRQLQASKTFFFCQSKYKNRSTKQEKFLKEVLKKRIDQQKQKETEKIIKRNKQANTSIKTVKKVEPKSENYNAKPPIKRSKQEVNLSFQAVIKRGEQTMKRKESSIVTAREYLNNKNMEQVTFKPHFQSSQKLRQHHSINFYERIEMDAKSRDMQKKFILRDILHENPFTPKLNDHANSNSLSKINSIRLKDEKFIKKKVTSIQLLQKVRGGSNWTYNQQYQINSDRNVLTQVSVVSHDLSFLLQ